MEREREQKEGEWDHSGRGSKNQQFNRLSRLIFRFILQIVLNVTTKVVNLRREGCSSLLLVAPRFLLVVGERTAGHCDHLAPTRGGKPFPEVAR